MNSPVDTIKERLSIEEVVSSYIKLDRAGTNFRAKCPFHNEKTPSFFVSPGRGSYYCFGCAASGDIFTFVEEFEGLDFKGALKLLAEKAGVQLESYNREDKESQSEKDRLMKAMEESVIYFSNNLFKNAEVLEYLKSRGLNEKSIKDFRIGYALDDWRLLYNHLKTAGFSDADIEKAGLAKKPEDASKGMYDRFRNRIMFPIADTSGRVIAFSGRLFKDDGKSAKYLNSPDTPIFSKSSVLFGLDRAKDAIRKNNFSILVEGQMDLVLSHQAGYKNTVATSGTALADTTVSKENVVNNLGLIRRLSDNIVLAFDADKAGLNACVRAGKIALSLGMDVKVAALPEGIDPADLISQKGLVDGSEAWKEAVRDSKHLIEFLLLRALKIADERKVGRVVKEQILPFVNALESSIEKMHFIKKISDLSGIPQKALQDDLKKVEKELQSEKEEIQNADIAVSALRRKDYITKKLLGIAFWQESLQNKAINPEIIFEKLGSVKESYQDRKEDLIYEAEEFYSNTENLEKDLHEMLGNLEEEHLNEELMRNMVALKNIGDLKQEAEILKKIHDISKRKEEIKNNRK
jgi:DNA primase